ncbi:MAG: esterase/lipase family protein [Hyphomicrobiales bacterium]
MAKSELIRDLVVILPGIMGSTLAKKGKLVWAPSGGVILKAITTFGRSIKEMTLPQGIGNDHPKDGVEPVALMPDLHLLPGIWSVNIGYEALLNFLRTRFHLIERSPDDPERIANLLPVAYDWRLSNRYNGKRLKSFVEPALERWRAQGGQFAEAKLIFICHSMGGIVARWFIEKEGGAEITRKLITLGTPYRGALNALDQLVNGVRKGIGPLKVDLTSFARSLPSIHQLLPEYACIETGGGLVKTTEITLPELDPTMVDDAMRFHDELDRAASDAKASLDIHPIVGTRQATFTTARISGSSVDPMETIGSEDEGGDATVPRLAAIPKGLRPNSPVIRYIADQHGSLQSNQNMLYEIEGILTAKRVIHRGMPQLEIGIRTEPVVLAREKIVVQATVAGGERVALQAEVMNEQGKKVTTVRLRTANGVHRSEIDPLPPGAYRIIVGGVGSAAGAVSPVTTVVLVWSESTD